VSIAQILLKNNPKIEYYFDQLAFDYLSKKLYLFRKELDNALQREE